MEINALSTASTARPGSRTGAQGDFQTFLTMLTVQMQNQDPLNPMDASDFAVQLATFSGVEQQTYTNQLLGAMLNQAGLADLGTWVGMEARLTGAAHFDGTAIELAPEPAAGADSVTLVVRNAAGDVVDTRALTTDLRRYVWDGLGANGQPLATGSYSFELISSLRGQAGEAQPVAAYQPIVEARQEGNATFLILPGQRQVDSAQVTGLRRPGA